MNAIFRFRFASLFLLVSTLLFTSCKKDNIDPVVPADVTDRVAGLYTYTELTSGGKTYPASETNLRGTVSITRQTATTVKISFAITQKNGGAFLDDTLENVTVSESGNEVSYTYEGQTFATGKTGTFKVNGRDAGNDPFTLTATK